MRITRSRKLIVSMGDYEQYHFGAEISATNHDLGVTDDKIAGFDGETRDRIHADLHKLVSDELDKALALEIEDAADLTSDKKSFLLRALKP